VIVSLAAPPMPEDDISVMLIRKKTTPYGLAPRKWKQQLDQIRELPEVSPDFRLENELVRLGTAIAMVRQILTDYGGTHESLP
jgi:hypothetical protein